jgi:hypothetical protein
MKSNSTKLAGLLIIVLSLVAGSASAQGTAFTYQGRLTDGPNAATGIYDLRFTIYDLASGGAVQGGPVTNAATAVSNGLFTVTLDFGTSVFNGTARWLEIGVRPDGGGGFTTLTPRQQLMSTPYAIRAATTPASGLSGTISPASIGAGTITGAMIANGAVGSTQLAAGAVGNAQLAEGAVTANKVFTITNWEHPSFLVSIPHPGRQQFSGFGTAVAVVGPDKFVVGAQNDDAAANGGGAAYLFDLSGNLLATLTNPVPASGDSLGQSVASVGPDRILVGSPINFTSGGTAYLFNTSGGLITTYTNPASSSGSFFGWGLAGVGSDKVLIGAWGNDPAGVAYLFSTNGSLLHTFTNPLPASVVGFGRAVALLGHDRVLIGAPNDIAQTTGGLVFLFHTNGTLLTTFTNPTPALQDGFGFTLAAVGNDQVLIGDITDDTGHTNAGAAYLFSTNGTLLTTFTNPAPGLSDLFGWSLTSVGDDKVLISAYADDDGALDAGTVYLFDLAGNLLATIRNPAPIENDVFGYVVAGIDANRILIGEGNGGPITNRFGMVHLFTFTPYAPGLLADTVSGGGVTTPSLADQAVTTIKIADYAITTEKLMLGAVGTDQLAVNAITTDKLTNGAVTADKIFRVTDWLQPLPAIVRTNPTPESNDEFGFSMARAGDTRLAVGAPKDSTGSNLGGAVYLYNLSFGLVQVFNNPTPATGDAFGYAVAGLDAERVLIGAYSDDAGAVDSGTAYLFRRQSPTLLLTLTNPAPNTDDRFGFAVANVALASSSSSWSQPRIKTRPPLPLR